jgi:hypothetical protein
MIPVEPQEQRSRLPSWAAGLIGGLAALAMVALGVVWYLTHIKPAPGALTVETTPRDVDIYLNDKLVSNGSPFTLDNLAPATYVLRVEKAGFQTMIRAVAVGDGEARMESLTLEAKKGNASVVLLTKPPGLAVWIDGKDTGRVSPATIAELTQGDHQVILKRNQTVVHRVRVSLGDGAAATIDVDATKLPTILDVVSEPSGASVRINGESKGKTPITVPGVRAGALRVEIEREGCNKFETSVTPERSSVTTVSATLQCAQP